MAVLGQTTNFHLTFHAFLTNSFHVVFTNNVEALVAFSFWFTVQFFSLKFIIIAAGDNLHTNMATTNFSSQRILRCIYPNANMWHILRIRSIEQLDES